MASGRLGSAAGDIVWRICWQDLASSMVSALAQGFEQSPCERSESVLTSAPDGTFSQTALPWARRVYVFSLLTRLGDVTDSANSNPLTTDNSAKRCLTCNGLYSGRPIVRDSLHDLGTFLEEFTTSFSNA